MRLSPDWRKEKRQYKFSSPGVNLVLQSFDMRREQMFPTIRILTIFRATVIKAALPLHLVLKIRTAYFPLYLNSMYIG